jgi:hypothetical protein
MKELDDSFQETVKRALTPWKEDTTPEKRDMDVSQLHAFLTTLGQAGTTGPKPYIPNPTSHCLAPLQRRTRDRHLINQRP